MSATSHLFMSLGIVAGTLLVLLLVASTHYAAYRFWPTPGPGTWQSMTFWSLFRTLNASAIAGALLEAPTLSHAGSALGLPVAVRFAALVMLALILALYAWALQALGKSNTYCGRNGLMTRGIYRWSRNPQYATIMPLYVAMAVAADTVPIYLLSTLLVAVYWLMARAEEPWLAASYGEDYARYCRAVPRFFNWRRVRLLALAAWRHAILSRLAPTSHRI